MTKAYTLAKKVLQGEGTGNHTRTRSAWEALARGRMRESYAHVQCVGSPRKGKDEGKSRAHAVRGKRLEVKVAGTSFQFFDSLLL